MSSKEVNRRYSILFGFSLLLVPLVPFAQGVDQSENAEECLTYDRAKIEARREFEDVNVIDFSQSSVGCLEKFARSFSRRHLVYVTLDSSKEWQKINYDAAKQHMSEGRSAVVFIGHQHQHQSALKAECALSDVWVNGVRVLPATFCLGPYHPIDVLGADFEKAIAIREEAVNIVYQKGLVALGERPPLDQTEEE